MVVRKMCELSYLFLKQRRAFPRISVPAAEKRMGRNEKKRETQGEFFTRFNSTYLLGKQFFLIKQNNFAKYSMSLAMLWFVLEA